MDFQEQNRLFKVRNTILEMIRDRNILVPEGLFITFEEFKQLYEAKNLDMFIESEKDGNPQKVYVHFHNESKSFGKNDLKALMGRIIETYQDESIIVILLLRDKENSMVTKELQKEIYANVEIFLQNNMVINITKHVLVPRHQLLTLDEEEEYLQKYNITKNKSPKILKTDPIARYYGAKVDQIFKIYRMSSSTGESFYYRVVK